jgi:hypothetical protein
MFVLPLVTNEARYVLGFSIAACVVALGVALATWSIGRRENVGVARARGLLALLTALVALVLVLLLVLIYAL